MDLFEQYQKDWKDGKANHDSSPLSNLKNKEIMDQLIRYEQEEIKGIKKGLKNGLIAIILGLAFGLTGIVLGGGSITLVIILGAILTLFSILFTSYKLLEKEPIQTNSQNTSNYLKQAKEKLIARKLKIKKYTTIYVVICLIGIGMVISMLPYLILAAIIFGGASYFFWDVRKDPHLIKQLLELDQKMSDLK